MNNQINELKATIKRLEDEKAYLSLEMSKENLILIEKIKRLEESKRHFKDKAKLIQKQLNEMHGGEI